MQPLRAYSIDLTYGVGATTSVSRTPDDSPSPYPPAWGKGHLLEVPLPQAWPPTFRHFWAPSTILNNSIFRHFSAILYIMSTHLDCREMLKHVKRCWEMLKYRTSTKPNISRHTSTFLVSREMSKMSRNVGSRGGGPSWAAPLNSFCEFGCLAWDRTKNLPILWSKCSSIQIVDRLYCPPISKEWNRRNLYCWPY